MFYNPSAIDVWISVNNKAVCIPSNQTVKIEKTSDYQMFNHKIIQFRLFDVLQEYQLHVD